MKYSNEIVIDLSRPRVIELFDNPDNLVHWQPGFISMEHISGEPGKPGAKTRLKYKMGKRDIEMIETITVRDLPEEFSGTYEAKGVWNEVVNRFETMGPDRTKWISHSEFRCGGMMKLVAWLMPGMFKKQSYCYMENFKAFAEKGTSIADKSS